MNKIYTISIARIFVIGILAFFNLSVLAQCGFPGNLSTSNVTSCGAIYSWDPVAGAQYYYIEYRDSGTSTWSIGEVTSSPDYIYGIVIPGGTTEWRMATVCNSGTSGYSPSVFFRAPYPSGCSCPPSNETAINVGTTTATITWSSLPGILYYNYNYQLWNITEPVYGSTTDTFVNLTGLSPSGQYNWQVQSVCGSDSSPLQYGAYNWFTTQGDCPSPDTLATTNITNTSATITWSSVSGNNGYYYQYDILDYFTGDEPFYTTTDTSATIYGLDESTDYVWQVSTACSVGTSTFSQSTFQTNFDCNLPNSPSVSNVGTTRATFSWQASGDANSYTYQYSPVGNSSWTSGTSSGVSVAITGLTPGTTYQWQVQTNCSTGTSTFVSGNNFSTLGLLCGAPGGLISSNVTGSTATFTWNPDSAATGYNIHYRVVGTTNWTVTSSSNDTLYATGLRGGSNYEWQVQSTCSPYSASANFTTVCFDPYNFVVSHITNNSVTLSWPPVDGGTQYGVLYKIYGSSNSWTTARTNADSINITGLTASTEYTSVIFSICDPDSTDAFGVDFSTSCGFPEYTNFNATNTNMIFRWTPVPGATGYNIKYKAAISNNYIALGTTTADTFNLNSLNANSGYDFEVQSVCPDGPSAWNVTENYTYQYPAPTGEITENITTTTATLKWSPVPGATQYFINFYGNITVNGKNWGDYYFTSNTDSLNVTGLFVGEPYSWTVEVYSGGESAFSPTIYFNTTCGVPTGLQYNNGYSDGISWTDVQGAYNYNYRFQLLGDTVWQTFPNVYSGGPEPEYIAGRAYRGEVQAICSNEITSAWSAPDTFITICDEPGSGDPTNITATSAVLHWGNIPGYDTVYLDYYYVAGPDDFPEIDTVVGGDSLLITGLLPNNTYGWNVRTKCDIGISDYTNPIWFYTAYPDTVTIVANPGPSICPGATVQFTATVKSRAFLPTYYWLLNGDTVQSGGSNTYSNSNLHNGDAVVCVAQNLNNEVYYTMTASNTIHITVNPVVTPTISITSSLLVKICEGELCTFKATATSQGTTPVYTWLINGTVVQSNSSPQYKHIFTYNPIYGTKLNIRCILTSSAACVSPVTDTSNNIALILEVKPLATVISGPTHGVCGGTTWDYTCTPVTGATQYLWVVPKKCTIDSGQYGTTIKVTFPANFDSSRISVVARNSCGNAPPAYLTIKCSSRSEETGVEEVPDAGDIRLNVYPNPNNGQMYIDLQQTEPAPVSYKVFNMLGQMVHEYNSTEPVANFQQSLDLGTQPGGMYFIQMKAGEAVLVKSVVITK